MLAVIGAINGVAPVAAPMAGGGMAGSLGWQGIFWALFVLGILLLAGSIHFRESLPATRRQHASWRDVYAGFVAVTRNRRYVCYIFQFGFAQGVLFANISSAPFIMQEHYGFSPLMFSVCFGINALAIVISAASSVRFLIRSRPCTGEVPAWLSLRCCSVWPFVRTAVSGSMKFCFWDCFPCWDSPLRLRTLWLWTVNGRMQVWLQPCWEHWDSLSAESYLRLSVWEIFWFLPALPF